jgi:hypothetical protein
VPATHWTIPEKKLKKELEKKNPKSPKTEKQVNKTNDKRRRIRCPCDRHRTFSAVEERGTICANS